MYTCVFVDWENIEKAAKKDYGAVLNFDEFVKVIRIKAIRNKSLLVGVYAYGDFDKGIAGFMSALVNLGVEPKHVITKTAQEYLKGSTDIEMSLDILDTMYNYPHITDFMFISGDSDLRYIIKRLKMHGKKIIIMAFRANTARYLIENADEYICLEEFPQILRKVTASEREQAEKALISNDFAHIIVKKLNELEKGDKEFVGLNLLRKKLLDHYPGKTTLVNETLTSLIDNNVFKITQVANPNDPENPTKACCLDKNNPVVKHILKVK